MGCEGARLRGIIPLEHLLGNDHSFYNHQQTEITKLILDHKCKQTITRMISEHVTDWLGFPVKLFNSELSEEAVEDYTNTIYRLALDWDSEVDFPTLFSRFIANPNSRKTPAIIIGQFHQDDPTGGSAEVVQLLVSAQAQLPNLRGIFLGDLISEENEISWIVQTDVSPLLLAYPSLEHLRLRGTGELSLGGRLVHEKLKSLTIETGGLPPALIQEVFSSKFPALESLELWLGTPSYGGEVAVADLQPLLSGSLFPALKHLGLRDSEIVNEIAEALSSAQILSRLDSLDLSLGTLSDEGGKALLENPALKRLKRLDLHRHYLSKQLMTVLKREFPGVNVEEPQGSDTSADDRYVAVGE